MPTIILEMPKWNLLPFLPHFTAFLLFFLFVDIFFNVHRFQDIHGHMNTQRCSGCTQDLTRFSVRNVYLFKKTELVLERLLCTGLLPSCCTFFHLLCSTDLIFRVAEAASVEVRGKHNDFVKQGNYSAHTGASCFSPVINIMRDPRWGRNQVWRVIL